MFLESSLFARHSWVICALELLLPFPKRLRHITLLFLNTRSTDNIASDATFFASNKRERFVVQNRV